MRKLQPELGPVMNAAQRHQATVQMLNDKVEQQQEELLELRTELAEARAIIERLEGEQDAPIAEAQQPQAKVCDVFEWVGQSLKHCDRCGQPYWEHSHEKRNKRGDGPFSETCELVLITREQAAAVRAKWDHD